MGGSAGGQGIVSRVASLGDKNTPAQPVAEYNSVTPNVYNPAFSSDQTNAPGGLGGTIRAAVLPAFQGELQGGLKAGAGPVNHIAPMPTMTNELVAPAFEGPRTGGPGMGPPADMVRPAQPVSPVVQQMMQRQMPQFNPYNTGLQSLFNRFMMPQPMMRSPMPMPQYGRPGMMNPLAYRPNIQQVQQNLGRVKPSVYKSELDAARARIAELEGQRSGGE